ncbi:MAG: hypothetical protein ISN29_10215, partial [Gammaproteobacteria bacterium AqS3]|nr:hypothetical protein [Gammaproteobacteria bacterium AqS3]
MIFCSLAAAVLLLLCAAPVRGQIVSNPLHLLPTQGTTVSMGSIDEGDSTDLNIRLSSEPDSSVSVALTIFTGSAPTDASVAELDNIRLVFTSDNWDDYQTVTLSTKETDTHYEDSSHSILVNPQTLSGGTYNTAGLYLFSITNNDTPDLVLSSNSVTLHEGGSGTFTVELAVPPTGTVTVRLWQVGLVNTDVTLDTDTAADGNQNTL